MRRAKASRAATLFAATLGISSIAPWAAGAIVINEFTYDDGSTDDREFIELYNTGAAPVDISGWTVGGIDATTTNPIAVIPSGTVLAPGAFWVIGNSGVLNVNQVVAANFLENDNETLELRDGPFATGNVVDAVVYETNKGASFASGIASQTGPGIWGNNQSSDLPGTPLLSSGGMARFVDGRDTNNNGRDFGFRPNTPGSSNNPINVTVYPTPDPTGGTVGSAVGGFAYSFVPPRVIDPTVADTNNPNAIPPAPSTGNRAIIAWDPSGGGNAVSSVETFNTTQSRFDIKAYLDTRDLPLMSNASGVNFRGSEITIYGIGGAEALCNLTDLSGAVGIADSANGFTGILWVYEKVGETGPGLGDVSEKLYLVDANDGGDAGTGGAIPLDWTILATIDLSTTASGWFDLGISIDAAGNGTAYFDTQVFNFTTSTDLHSGAFNVGYRENTQIGSDGTPDAILRPPTFTIIPEPASLSLLAGTLLAMRRRRG